MLPIRPKSRHLMFDFASWWDDRCFESCELTIHQGHDGPLSVPGSGRVHFVNRPAPVQLKPGESDGTFKPMGRREYRQASRLPGY